MFLTGSVCFRLAVVAIVKGLYPHCTINLILLSNGQYEIRRVCDCHTGRELCASNPTITAYLRKLKLQHGGRAKFCKRFGLITITIGDKNLKMIRR